MEIQKLKDLSDLDLNNINCIKAKVSFFNNCLNKQFSINNNVIKSILFKHLENLNNSVDIIPFSNYNNIYNKDIKKEASYIFEAYSNNILGFINMLMDLNSVLNQKDIYINLIGFSGDIKKTILLSNKEIGVL